MDSWKEDAKRLEHRVKDYLYKYDIPNSKAEFSVSFGRFFCKVIVDVELTPLDHKYNRVISRIEVCHETDNEPIVLVYGGKKSVPLTEENFLAAIAKNVKISYPKDREE
jgi:hypothetical protein